MMFTHLALLVLFCTACEDSQFAPGGDYEFSMHPAEASIALGGTQNFFVSLADDIGSVVPNQAIIWTSSNTDVAQVSGSGVVTALEVGEATITARPTGEYAPSVGDQSVSAVVTVYAPVVSVSVTPSPAAVTAGETVQLTAVTRDVNGGVLTGRTVTWSSSNGAIATVNGNGVASGLIAGSAIITATSENRSGTTTLTVAAPNPSVGSVTVTPSGPSVQAGATVQLTAEARDGAGTVIPGQTFSWSSSSTNVATVNSSGRVTGVTAGTATITARTSGVSGNTSVTVQQASPPPSGAGLLFSSAWNTARGWSEAAYTDGGRWTFVSADRGVPNKEVVDAAGLDMPSANAWNAIATAAAQGWVQLRTENLPMPAIGGSTYYRWYMRVMQPDGLDDNSTHPVEAGGSDPWAFEVENAPAYGLPPGTFTIWMYTSGGGTFNRTRWFLGGGSRPIALRKGQTYRFEYQVHRTGTSTMQQHIRVYDAAGTLLYDDDDFLNLDGVRMSQGGDLALTGGTAGMGTLQFGNNGIGGAFPTPTFTYAYYGAVCIRSDTWCGPYRDGI